MSKRVFLWIFVLLVKSSQSYKRKCCCILLSILLCFWSNKKYCLYVHNNTFLIEHLPPGLVPAIGSSLLVVPSHKRGCAHIYNPLPPPAPIALHKWFPNTALGTRVLRKLSWGAPPKNLKSPIFYAKKWSLTLDMRGCLTILLSGALQPFKGWETLLYLTTWDTEP